MSFNRLEGLKKEKDAVILAHYYVDEPIQKVADYVGDSFYLAQVAKKLKNKVIVMAGVYFMGESVKILNPEKKVLMVNIEADCPMAHMISIEKIESMRKKYDDLAVVTYINSTAEIKAHSDVCVTSSNAVNIVKKLKQRNIFFVPDKNLGSYIAKFIGSEKNIILNDGYCPVHNTITYNNVKNLKKLHKDAKVLVHPECREEVLNLADYIGSTKGIIEAVERFDEDEFIIVTEEGISAKLYEKYPDKKFYFIDDFICQDMKMLKVEELEEILENEKNKVFVDEDIARRALIPLDLMLELGAN